MRLREKKINSLKEMRRVVACFDRGFVPSISNTIADLEEHTKKLLKYAQNYIFLDNENICGWVSFYANDKKSRVGYITHLIVDDKYRGLGVGRKILEFTEHCCRKEGMKVLKLEVQKRNFGALKLYEHFGFRIAQDLGASFYMEKPIIACEKVD